MPWGCKFWSNLEVSGIVCSFVNTIIFNSQGVEVHRVLYPCKKRFSTDGNIFNP